MTIDNGAKVSPFPSSYRAFNCLPHVTSLPSRYDIGDVGPFAVAWIDRLSDAGQSRWQALPLDPTGYGNSLYHNSRPREGRLDPWKVQ